MGKMGEMAGGADTGAEDRAYLWHLGRRDTDKFEEIMERVEDEQTKNPKSLAAVHKRFLEAKRRGKGSGTKNFGKRGGRGRRTDAIRRMVSEDTE
jgi:hypothetical protein